MSIGLHCKSFLHLWKCTLTNNTNDIFRSSVLAYKTVGRAAQEHKTTAILHEFAAGRCRTVPRGVVGTHHVSPPLLIFFTVVLGDNAGPGKSKSLLLMGSGVRLQLVLGLLITGRILSALLTLFLAPDFIVSLLRGLFDEVTPPAASVFCPAMSDEDSGPFKWQSFDCFMDTDLQSFVFLFT